MSDEPGPSQSLIDTYWEHAAYLKQIAADGLVSPAVAEAGLVLWLFSAGHLGLPIPAACTGPDGQLQYSWDRAEHHLEAEIVPDKPVGWFYRNRTTGETWAGECGPRKKPRELAGYANLIRGGGR